MDEFQNLDEAMGLWDQIESERRDVMGKAKDGD